MENSTEGNESSTDLEPFLGNGFSVLGSYSCVRKSHVYPPPASPCALPPDRLCLKWKEMADLSEETNANDFF